MNLRPVIVLFVLLGSEFSLSQDQRTFPYGGVVNIWGGLDFKTYARLYGASFDNKAKFEYACFFGVADFNNANFDSAAIFANAVFEREANFKDSKFSKTANFKNASFKDATSFFGAEFESTANFDKVTFESTVDFRITRFNDTASFVGVLGKGFIDFKGAVFSGLLLLGSESRRSISLKVASRPTSQIDLSLAAFQPTSRIELSSPIELKLGAHKLEKLTLEDGLFYSEKHIIIETLKEKSYPGNKVAAFELDYILAKSSMWQEKIDAYEPYSRYHISKWPKWFLSWLYDATMGLGFRPFRILWWALGVIFVETIFYYFKMGKRIDAYVVATFKTKAEKQKPHLTEFETFLNCAYFSVMLFFTFRFKGNLLTFFDATEKKYIVAEWMLGLAVYVAFLYHTSSVVQSIRSLFVGG